MPRTTLANRLQDAASIAKEAAIRNVPTGQVLEERASQVTRRDFIKLSSAALAALTFQPLMRASAAAPKIAVVGAGLAGLTAAYRLKQAGYAATVFEASEWVGGRCWSDRTFFDDGQIF